ncbi:MAG: geranylgeranyl reductase family protein, partial [Candidatus Zixiibacteriota bacterium]
MSDADFHQAAPDTLPDPIWDVAVIGAGPAGSTAALHLARNGHKVLLVEKDRFPRDKTCGDFLFADTIESLKGAGLLESVRRIATPVNKIVVCSPSGIPVEVPGEFLTVKRIRFDNHLAEKAVEAGAKLVRGKVSDLRVSHDSMVTIVSDREHRQIQSRFAILATGADVGLAGRLGLIRDKAPSAVAMRCYVRSTYQLEHAVLSYDRSLIPGYGWVIPVGNNEFNVGCGAHYHDVNQGRYNLKEAFARFLAEFPVARELMRRGEQISRLQAAPLRCRLNRLTQLNNGNVLAVGETIGATLPFTGEGIGTAMRSAELAAAAVSESLKSGNSDSLKQYRDHVFERMLPRHQGHQVAEKWMGHRLLNDLMAWRLSRSPFLQDRLREFLTKTGN